VFARSVLTNATTVTSMSHTSRKAEQTGHHHAQGHGRSAATTEVHELQALTPTSCGRHMHLRIHQAAHARTTKLLQRPLQQPEVTIYHQVAAANRNESHVLGDYNKAKSA
jgi:hypothetical protein